MFSFLKMTSTLPKLTGKKVDKKTYNFLVKLEKYHFEENLCHSYTSNRESNKNALNGSQDFWRFVFDTIFILQITVSLKVWIDNVTIKDKLSKIRAVFDCVFYCSFGVRTSEISLYRLSFYTGKWILNYTTKNMDTKKIYTKRSFWYSFRFLVI